MSQQARWSDLAPRVLSGLAMAGIGAGAIWIGGWLFNGLICALGGLMIWEASRMAGARGAVSAGLLAAVALALALLLPGILVLPLLAAAALVGAGQAPRDKGLHVLFALWILLGCYVTAQLRQEAGFGWMVWLVLVVVVSDVAGYFAGRMLGGPKFWPRVSPKKTWSGTLAGWVGAGLVGLLLAESLTAGAGLVAVSMLVGFAGQLGDIAESAIKRRCGVKDSSDLIPGHGGVLDRFDAMLGAAMMVMVLWLLSLMPGLQ
ncbi:phosphatidate cytidylyltransferase [Roseovarius pacificus]|uniref:phosphatidate cytidylyltransferase n=1 Tax=Roseovarius pacificus TaxID=337701 RepID=UPI002A18A1B6|nr:phosphatidate cytidylyltransferase [Roseovarius pacificus]